MDLNKAGQSLLEVLNYIGVPATKVVVETPTRLKLYDFEGVELKVGSRKFGRISGGLLTDLLEASEEINNYPITVIKNENRT